MPVTRRVRWEGEPALQRLRKGQRVVADGEISYGQDFSWWRNDFGDTAWTVHEVWAGEEPKVILEAPGYGITDVPGQYGNGKIYVFGKSINRLRVL